MASSLSEFPRKQSSTSLGELALDLGSLHRCMTDGVGSLRATVFLSVNREYLKQLPLGMVAHTCHPALGRLREEDHELKASLGYIVILCLKSSAQTSRTTAKKKKKLTRETFGSLLNHSWGA